MAFKWPPKDPDEVLDYSVDWSRYLNAATITTVTWFIDDEDGAKTEYTNGNTVNGLQRVSATNTDTVATLRVGLGTENTNYKIYCQITDSEGLTSERAINLRIRSY